MIVKKINDIKRINLHLHTNVSDGALSPTRLLQRALEIKLDLVSITDHDTFDAYNQIRLSDFPIRVLPGMEVSSIHRGSDVHILAYGCDKSNLQLGQMTDMYRKGRRDRAIRMIGLLRELGMPITLEEVIEVAGSRELIVRPHIAQILLRHGFVKSKNEAFDKYIGNDKPAHVHKPELLVPEVLKIIHAAGGFAVVAHPGKLVSADYLPELIEMGVDGLEVWHPDHNSYQVNEFIDTALKNGLLMTAGSDYHGELDNHNLFDVVPVSQIVLDSVNSLYQEYLCRVS